MLCPPSILSFHQLMNPKIFIFPTFHTHTEYPIPATLSCEISPLDFLWDWEMICNVCQTKPDAIGCHTDSRVTEVIRVKFIEPNFVGQKEEFAKISIT